MTVRPGTVYLVGAGPGDPGLLTVRGREILERADVILYDRLVSPALLERAPITAERIDAGKTRGHHKLQQQQINALLVDHAKRNRIVVRLKGGDPFVFGRGFEELQACRDENIPCEVIPGVTSAIAGPAAFGIPVTLRGIARHVSIVTPERGDGASFQLHEYAALAQLDTIVSMMGVARLNEFVEGLINAGLDARTPVAVVERATQSGQRCVVGTLADIVDRAIETDVRPPAIIVVGEVAALAQHTTGNHAPLHGRRIVVTRPRHASHELTQRLAALGAHVIDCPAIEITYCDAQPHDWMRHLNQYDWIVFTSRHGVRGFRRAVEQAQRDVRCLSHTTFAAVGPITARELATWGINADLVPDVYRAEHLAAALLERGASHALVPCGTLGGAELRSRLAEGGAQADLLTVYETRLVSPDRTARDEIERGVDAVLFASPSAVKAIAQSDVALGRATIVCIGPTTASEAARQGFENIVTASAHHDEGMVQALTDAIKPMELAS